MCGSAVSAIEPHNVEILILDPNATQEAAFSRLRQRRYVKHQTAHFAQKFALYVVKLVVLAVESGAVNEHHLQKAVRQILHRERKEVPDAHKDLLPLAVRIGNRDQAYALGEVRLAQKILVARRNR